MDLDIPHLLMDLAARRPVFHSEADFQHELAWHLRQVHPDLQVRLEYPFARPSNVAIDILIRKEGQEIALELKYLCQRVGYEVDGEPFVLKPQGTQDIRRYDVLKDVWRMERFLEARPTAFAGVLALTNDPAYWCGPQELNTCDAAFALREGRSITGLLDWAPHTGAGTKQGRETSINLRGQYRMTWADYSRISGPVGVFRFLYLPVEGP